MVLNNILVTIIKIGYGVVRLLLRLPQRAVLFVMRWYQVTFSPDHGAHGRSRYPLGYCRFTPSCSEYACQAVEKHGVVWGGLKSLWRVVRCNPWSKGGHDPLR